MNVNLEFGQKVSIVFMLGLNTVMNFRVCINLL